jgi:hypothetical protein
MALLFKNNHKSGSAILIVVLVMSVLSICCITFWQKSLLFYDISIKRLEYEQKYRAAACALEYATWLCSKNFDKFIKLESYYVSGTGLAGLDLAGKGSQAGKFSAQSLAPHGPNPKVTNSQVLQASRLQVINSQGKSPKGDNFQVVTAPGIQSTNSQELNPQGPDPSGPDLFEIETEEFKFSENIKYKCKIYISKDGSRDLNLKSVLFDASGEKAFEMSCSLVLSETVDLKDKNIKKCFTKNWKVCDK